MTVAVQLEFRGTTLEHYDRINETIGRLPGGPAPNHELFHWVTGTDDGFLVVDVWDSRADFEAFLHDRLEPAFTEVGVSAPPEIRYFDVHSFSIGGRWRR